jgi:hypothetical protein
MLLCHCLPSGSDLVMIDLITWQRDRNSP